MRTPERSPDNAPVKCEDDFGIGYRNPASYALTWRNTSGKGDDSLACAAYSLPFAKTG